MSAGAVTLSDDRVRDLESKIDQVKQDTAQIPVLLEKIINVDDKANRAHERIDRMKENQEKSDTRLNSLIRRVDSNSRTGGVIARIWWYAVHASLVTLAGVVAWFAKGGS